MRIITANERTHVAIFDANAAEYFDMNNGGIMMDTCPECGAAVSEEMDHCPDCATYVIWENSKKWRKAFFRPTDKKIEEVERTWATDLESIALEALQCASAGKPLGYFPVEELFVVWPSGTVRKLRELRTIEDIPDWDEINTDYFREKLMKAARSAIRKCQQWGSPAANYMLQVLIVQLGGKAKLNTGGRFIRKRRRANSHTEEKAAERFI